MNSYVLALDLGNSIKAMVATVTGEVVATATSPAPARVPRNASPLAREFSPQVLWRAVTKVARHAIASAAVRAEEIAAIGVTAQRQGIALLDGTDRELYLGPNTDLRAVFEGAALDEGHRDLLYQTTGHLPPFLMAPAKLRWFQLHRPRLYQRVRSILTLGDWAAFRLTGERLCERTLAGEAGLLDVTTGQWACQMMRRLDLRDDWFPPLVPAGSSAGPLTRRASEELGLRPGVPVVAAGPDTQCGLLGMGTTATGSVGVLAGWSVTAQQVTRAPLFGEQKTWAGLHVVPGRWVCEVNLGDAGAVYQWIARLLYGRGPRAEARMERETARILPGSNGADAFLGPAPLDMRRLGLRLGGMLMPVPIGHAGVGRDALARAALEGTAFGLRGALELLQGATGSPAADVALGGGMVRSGPLPQMLADIWGRPVLLARHHHVSAYGAALSAACAVGGFSGLEEVARRGREETSLLQPDPEAALQYNDLYLRWQRRRAGLEELGLN